MPIKNEIRKKNYRRLRDAGFNSHEANRYKSRSQYTVDELIRERVECNKRIKYILGDENNE